MLASFAAQRIESQRLASVLLSKVGDVAEAELRLGLQQAYTTLFGKPAPPSWNFYEMPCGGLLSTPATLDGTEPLAVAVQTAGHVHSLLPYEAGLATTMVALSRVADATDHEGAWHQLKLLKAAIGQAPHAWLLIDLLERVSA